MRTLPPSLPSARPPMKSSLAILRPLSPLSAVSKAGRMDSTRSPHNRSWRARLQEGGPRGSRGRGGNTRGCGVHVQVAQHRHRVRSMAGEVCCSNAQAAMLMQAAAPVYPWCAVPHSPLHAWAAGSAPCGVQQLVRQRAANVHVHVRLQQQPRAHLRGDGSAAGRGTRAGREGAPRG